MQDSNGNDAVFTMVWGTDINVTDIQNQFTQFVKGFRQQTGIDEEGVPVLEAEAKYMAYLKDVRSCCCCCHCNGSEGPMLASTQHPRAVLVWSSASTMNCLPLKHWASAVWLNVA